MKGFLKSKVVLTLAAILMITAAIAIPLSRRSIPIHAQGTVTFTEFPIPTANSNPQDITSGPDGNLWFTEFNGEKIGKITPNGTVTEYAIPTSNANPYGITSGPDGNVWFTESFGPSQIGKITPSGTITEYPTPTCCVSPSGITSGPDGNVWFTEGFGNKIAKSTPTGTITEYPIPTSNSGPVEITSGPDGNLWFTEGNVNQIGKITTGGTITEYAIPTSNSNPSHITSGPDGNIWFTESNTNQIGKITPSGTITEYLIPTSGSDPIGITSGPDGNLWFTEYLASKIGNITPNGTITEYPIPSGFGHSIGITSGPDNNIWFMEGIGNEIGRANLQLACPLTLTPPQPAGAPTLTQLSCDPYKDKGAQHLTEVEPDTLSAQTPNGTLIVSAFQVGRFFDGGAMNIGWATFTNGGSDIHAHGYLPGTTKFATPPGVYDRVSDASVAYDAKHNEWLISYLGVIGTTGKAVLVSRSTDGINWDILPVTVATGKSLDKNWTVCDNTPSSSFYGHCYTEWDDVSKGNLIQMSTSTDGGATWGTPLATAKSAHGLGGQPLVQPNGTVIVPYEGCTLVVIDQCIGVFAVHLLAFTSLDGGASWNAPNHIDGFVRFHKPAGNLRAGVLPSAGIDPSGKVYVTWSECNPEGFFNCPSNDIVLSTLTNVDPKTGATTWSQPTPVPIDPIGSGVDHFIPGLAVSQTTTPGSPAHIGLAYYYYPKANCTISTCDLDVGFISSSDGGVTWSAPRQLAGPMKLTWIADTTQGRMVGDYISSSFASGDAFPVFAAATAPSGGHLNEAMFTLVFGLHV